MEPTTAAALKAMEELGYVERRQLPENRKNVYVHLTPKGRALRAKLEPLARGGEQGRGARRRSARDVAACRRALLACSTTSRLEVPLRPARQRRGRESHDLARAADGGARRRTWSSIAHAGMAARPARAGLRTVAVGSKADHDALVSQSGPVASGPRLQPARRDLRRPGARGDSRDPRRSRAGQHRAGGGRHRGRRAHRRRGGPPAAGHGAAAALGLHERGRPAAAGRAPRLPGALPRWAWRSVFLPDPQGNRREARGQINAVRAELGLREPVRGIMRDWWMSRSRVLALFPDWFAPRRADWPPQTVLTRFPPLRRRPGARCRTPTHFLREGPAADPVHAGLGEHVGQAVLRGRRRRVRAARPPRHAGERLFGARPRGAAAGRAALRRAALQPRLRALRGGGPSRRRRHLGAGPRRRRAAAHHADGARPARQGPAPEAPGRRRLPVTEAFPRRRRRREAAHSS